MAKNSVLCPISHKSCKFCALYRGRHYYSLPACKEYLRRLHEEAEKMGGRVVRVTGSGEGIGENNSSSYG